MRAVYPGSFDPFHYGHLDLALRARDRFDEVVILICVNPNKVNNYLFTPEERKDIIEKMFEDHRSSSRIKVDIHSGSVTEYLKNGDVIIKGIRGVGDCESEAMQARLNKDISGDAETFLMVCDRRYIDVSSSAVKELCKLDLFGTVNGMVPTNIYYALRDKFKNSSD